MTWFRVGGAGIPASLKNGMNSVLNKKFGTTGQNYPPNGWPDDVNLLGPLPIKNASGAIASFSDGADDVPISSGVFSIVPSGGGGTPSAPVAITGHTGMTISHAGKNSLDTANAETKSSNSVSVTCDGSGKYTATGTATGGSANITFTLKTPCEIKSGMYLHLMSSPANANVSLTIQKQDNTSIYAPTLSPANRIIDLSSYVGETIYSIRLCVVNGASSELTFSPMLCYSNTATTFEPYKAPETLAVSWQDEAGTVYGGELNVTTGVLTVTYQHYTASDVTSLYWNGKKAQQVDTNHNATFRITTTSNYLTTASPLSNMLSHSYNITTGNGDTVGFQVLPVDGIYICVPLSLIGLSEATSSTDDSVFLDAIHNLGSSLEFAAKLATPQTYQLTAHELRTLYKNNNFYCDTGDSSIDYRADISLALQALQGSRSLSASLMRSAGPEEVSEPEENIQNTEEQEGDNDAR